MRCNLVTRRDLDGALEGQEQAGPIDAGRAARIVGHRDTGRQGGDHPACQPVQDASALDRQADRERQCLRWLAGEVEVEPTDRRPEQHRWPEGRRKGSVGGERVDRTQVQPGGPFQPEPDPLAEGLRIDRAELESEPLRDNRAPGTEETPARVGQ